MVIENVLLKNPINNQSFMFAELKSRYVKNAYILGHRRVIHQSVYL